ncbi:MAG: DMT family transporter [Aestuariivirga sp.]|nr:DMT family transporter [Aestuariivirga sp.]
MFAVLFGVFAALCWSVHDLIARMMAAEIGAFRMAALVMVSGGILLSFYVLYDGAIWNASWEQLMSGFLLGLAYGLGVGGLFKAFSLGPISLVGPITAGYPVLAVLWGVLNGLEPTLLQWGCVAATLVGAIIVARSGTEDGGINAVEPGKMPTLLFFAALAVLGYSSSIVLGQQAAVTVGEIEATWLSRATALVTILPFMLLGERKYTPLTGRHWKGIFIMGGLDVLGVIAINASGHLPGKEFAGVGISAYGALSVILAMIFLKEKVSPGQWVGLVMIVGAVATMALSQA